ncbi:hypothetical protein ACFLZ2_05985 [Candidatus Margulisiibacteriota bacterium]
MDNWLLVSFIGLVISIPLSALILMLSAKIFKLADVSFKTPLKIAAILGVSSFVFDALTNTVLASAAGVMGLVQFLAVNVALAVYLIQKLYTLDLKKSLLVWLVWLVLSIILMIIVGVIVGLIAGAFIAAQSGV